MPTISAKFCSPSQYNATVNAVRDMLKRCKITNAPSEYSFQQRAANVLRTMLNVYELEDIVLSRNFHYATVVGGRDEVMIGERPKGITPLVADIAAIALADEVRNNATNFTTPCVIEDNWGLIDGESNRWLLSVAPGALNLPTVMALLPFFGLCDLAFSDTGLTDEEMELTRMLDDGQLKKSILASIDEAQAFVSFMAEAVSGNANMTRYGYTLGLMESIRIGIKNRFETMSKFIKVNPKTNSVKFMRLLASDIRRITKPARHEFTHIVYDAVRFDVKHPVVDKIATYYTGIPVSA